METTLKAPTKLEKNAIFGWLSLLVFSGSVAVTLFFFLTVSSSGYMGAEAFGYGMFGLVIGCFACILSVGFAIVGLARRERPRWPAIVGLTLSLLPALGGIYILCGAPW